jgi:hypothetical protein
LWPKAEQRGSSPSSSLMGAASICENQTTSSPEN